MTNRYKRGVELGRLEQSDHDNNKKKIGPKIHLAAECVVTYSMIQETFDLDDDVRRSFSILFSFLLIWDIKIGIKIINNF